MPEHGDAEDVRPERRPAAQDEDLEERGRGRPDRLAEDDPGAPDGRHEDLAQEAVLAVPDDRDAGEERARQDALGDDARVDERDVVDARRERRARGWDALVGCQDEQVVGGP